MITLDNTPLLTLEVPIDFEASEIRSLSLQLVHGKPNMLKVRKLSLEKGSLC